MALSLGLLVVPRFPDVNSGMEVAPLGRDHDQIGLLAIYECIVRRSMQLLVDLRVPFVPFTVRRSIPVVSIEGLSDDEEAVLL